MPGPLKAKTTQIASNVLFSENRYFETRFPGLRHEEACLLLEKKKTMPFKAL